MIDAQGFINKKAFQLSNYADALLAGIIPSTDVDLYCWDTIEEWSQLKSSSFKVSNTESVFWYLLHQITFWNPKEIRTSPSLKSEVDSCIDFLRGDGVYPDFCSGVRP